MEIMEIMEIDLHNPFFWQDSTIMQTHLHASLLLRQKQSRSWDKN